MERGFALLRSAGMNRLTASARYARDLGEVLVLNRLKSPPAQREIAGEAATIVRRARFHAHAKIRGIELTDLLARLTPEPIDDVVLPGPRDLCGVGNATYYHALASLARAIRPSSVLEIGTYLGVGTMTIALNAPDDCRIVTVDLPDDPTMDDAHDLSRGDLELIARRRARVGEAFLRSPMKDRITQIRADSLTWEPDESLRPVDMVLIDGGHSGPIVRADTDNAFKLVAPTGTIIWDDYFYLYPGIVSYLDELVDGGRHLHVIRGTNLVVYDGRLQ